MIQVNRTRMEALMQAFHALTHIRIVLFDNELHEIMAYPQEPCDFCRQMRARPQFLQKCVVSDREAFRRSRHADGPVVYACHAGLTEAVVQLREDDSTIGYVMFGQVVPAETSRETRVRLSQACLGIGATELLETVFTMPAKTAEEIRAAATILETLAGYLWSSRVVTLAKKEFLDALDAYVDAHLCERITARDLCGYLGIGRTYLFKLAAMHLGGGIAGHVRTRRIREACRRLAETSEPVTAIAGAVGFTDYNYFSKCFRAETGMSARAFRSSRTVGGA